VRSGAYVARYNVRPNAMPSSTLNGVVAAWRDGQSVQT